MIYFDNAATTFLCDAARNIFLSNKFGNPSSSHILGLEAERAVKKAAKDISEILVCYSEELIFTSGGTESNNLGIMGVAFALRSSRGRRRPFHILASNQEHPSVAEPLKYLASLPGFSVTFAAPTEWEMHICEDTALICIAQVSSETGDILDIGQLKHNAVVFVDGAQGFCKIPRPEWADIYSFSGHKIHGPMGVGGLMVKKGIRIQPLMYGGGQQKQIRPGTENVMGILALAVAAKEVCASDHGKAAKIKEILSDLGEVNQKSDWASPYILNMSFPGIRGETLTNLLTSRGCYVSQGSACRNNAAKKESPLVFMGFNKKRAESAIRLSFSIMNTEEEARRAKEIIKDCIMELKR